MKLLVFLVVHVFAVILCLIIIRQVDPGGHIGILFVYYGILFIGMIVFYIVFQLFYSLINNSFLTNGVMHIIIFYLSTLIYVLAGIYILL